MQEAWHWLGRVVKVVDGATITMADTPENQRSYPQSGAQASGVGFPIARIVVIFSLAVGAVIDAAIEPCKGKQTGENNLFRSLLNCFLPGEVALADSYYASFGDFALLREQQVDLVARAHHKRNIDFRTGTKLGCYDHVVAYLKPAQCPAWLARETYERLPDSIPIRHLRYRVAQAGFRSRSITLATTLVDAQVYPADELANLYRRRWQVELHLRSLKTHLQMDHLRCKTPGMVRNEFYTLLLAYNLIRGIMRDAATANDVPPHQLSFKGAMQSLKRSWEWSSPTPTKSASFIQRYSGWSASIESAIDPIASNHDSSNVAPSRTSYSRNYGTSPELGSTKRDRLSQAPFAPDTFVSPWDRI